MSQLSATLTGCIISFFLAGSNLQDWELVRNDDNIKVYQQSNEQSRIHEYKAEATINTPIDSLFRFFLNFDNYHTWIPSCIESRLLLSNSDTAFVYYARYDLPWPFADRDAYSLITIKKEQEAIEVVSSPYCTNDNTQYKGVIRVQDYKENYRLEQISDSEVKFYMQGRYNPGGFIPAWLANKFIKYGPFDVIKSIQKANRPDTQ